MGLPVRRYHANVAPRFPPPTFAPTTPVSPPLPAPHPPPRSGEPTPYSWPNTNSHFGIIDLATFEKDRFYWYAAWFIARPPTAATVYVFPSTWTSWAPGQKVDVWAYSDGDEVELRVNGASLGRKPMLRYGHVEWDAVPFAPGSLHALAYKNGTSAALAEHWVNTTGAPAALRVSVRDGFGATMVAGCHDVALVMVEVVDAAGLVVDTDATVTFEVLSGPATLAGTANGDPSTLVNNLSPTRPAFHGLALGVLRGGADAGTVTVQASAPGLPPVSLSVCYAGAGSGRGAGAPTAASAAASARVSGHAHSGV